MEQLQQKETGRRYGISANLDQEEEEQVEEMEEEEQEEGGEGDRPEIWNKCKL